MKTFKVTLALLLAVAFTACSGSQKRTGEFSDGNGGYQLAPFEDRTLANGLKLIFMPDDKLPYFSLSMVLGSGADDDPSDQLGLAASVADLLDQGTTKRSATQIAQDLGFMGADFNASAGYDTTGIGISGLANQADSLLNNFVEIVTQPAFSDAEIDRVKKQMISGIQRRMDQPEAYADFSFARMLYGTHPYGRPVTGTLKTIPEIQKKNVIQYYLRYYRPNNAQLAVIGKYTPEMKEKIVQAFSGWSKREVPVHEFPKVETFTGLKVLLVDKPGLVQAQIRMGYPSIKRKNDDFIAIRMANTILGGAFASRLVDRVRKQLGLTYSISSGFDARQDSGPFEISTFTKLATIGQTVSESLKVLAEFHDKGITAEELERTKGYLKGTFPAAIETREKLAQSLMILRFYDVPDSYLRTYIQEVDRINLADINRVIQKYFDPNNIKVVVYADKAKAEPQLRALVGAAGSFEVRDAVAE